MDQNSHVNDEYANFGILNQIQKEEIKQLAIQYLVTFPIAKSVLQLLNEIELLQNVLKNKDIEY